MSAILDITVRLGAARSIAGMIPEMLPFEMAGGHYDRLSEVGNLATAIDDLLALALAAVDLLETQMIVKA
jgi:hypothetical protein